MASADAETREEGRIELPRVGFGTYRTGGYECFEAVRTALEVGYRHVDTAMAYENEAVVGRAIDVSPVDREDVLLTTKLKGYTEFLTYDRILAEAEACLERLGTDYVDLLLLHWWNEDADMAEAFAALNRLVDEGKVAAIGVSNFSVDQLRRAMAASEAPIRTNQVEYHPYHDQDELLAFCRANDVVLTAYSPLAEGLVVDDGALAAIGDRYGKSAAQVAIRWLVQQENVVAIPKTVTPSRAKENLDVDDFELTDREMEVVDDLEGPFWYRQNREGGHVYRLRGIVGPLVPGTVRRAIVG